MAGAAWRNGGNGSKQRSWRQLHAAAENLCFFGLAAGICACYNMAAALLKAASNSLKAAWRNQPAGGSITGAGSITAAAKSLSGSWRRTVMASGESYLAASGGDSIRLAWRNKMAEKQWLKRISRNGNTIVAWLIGGVNKRQSLASAAAAWLCNNGVAGEMWPAENGNNGVQSKSV